MILENEIIREYFSPPNEIVIDMPDSFKIKLEGDSKQVYLELLSEGCIEGSHTNIQGEPFKKLLEGLFGG